MELAIVGAGDTAAEEALYLSKLSPKVNMLVRSDKMRASAIMQERVENNPKIKIHWNTDTVEVLGEKMVEGVRIKNKITGTEEEIPVKGFFVAIGHKPNSDPFKDLWRRMSRDISKPSPVLQKPIFPVYSLQAMCRIRITGRPLLPQAPVAWLHSMRSGTSLRKESTNDCSFGRTVSSCDQPFDFTGERPRTFHFPDSIMK
jgi:hypothetical protein